MSSYNTPGVYVQEIPTLPPSVAGVATAVPAFIGYTERAGTTLKNELLFVPTSISSVFEYERLFGGPPPVAISSVTIDENNLLSSAALTAKYYMYNSLRMFFKNGGSTCFIVSIGLFQNKENKTEDYKTGILALSKAQEPTLILFPDAVALGSRGLYDVQKPALKHCATHKNRFCIFDLLESDASASTFGWKEGYEGFRDSIGINNLNYAAAYTPYLMTDLDLKVRYRDIRGKVTRGGQVLDFASLTTDTDAKNNLVSLENAIGDYDTIQKDIIDDLGSTSVREEFQKLVDNFNNNNEINSFRALFDYIYKIAQTINNWSAGTSPLKGDFEGKGLLKVIDDLILNSLLKSVSVLVGYDKGANSVFATTATPNPYNLYATYNWNATEWGGTAGSTTPFDAVEKNEAIYTGNNIKEKRANALPYLKNIFEQVYAGFNEIVTSAAAYEESGDKNLFDSHVVYRSLITALRNQQTVVPPSGAIAGIYAQVDNARGVWKAPANVSLAGVIGLTVQVSEAEQQDLNVDTIAGKSINVIRAFPGKGILVWGARTLAGNDNEWRYIPVRRFFLFAEESIKRTIEQFVFEPNVASTWIKVKGSIENFLTAQWRAGALAGATTQQAFFVHIGLGQTMTAQDILEGRLIVDVGMAVSRPAEFIILRFTHKLQES